jgi:hypothetical protein
VSYTGAVLNAAKSLSKSVVKIGESVLGYGNNSLPSNNTNINEKTLLNQPQSSSSSTNNNNNNNNNINPNRHRHGSGKDESQPGIVTIIDTVKLFGVRISNRITFYANIYLSFSSHRFMMKDKIGSLLIFKLILNL